jgi:hypothetical protein
MIKDPLTFGLIVGTRGVFNYVIVFLKLRSSSSM